MKDNKARKTRKDFENMFGPLDKAHPDAMEMHGNRCKELAKAESKRIKREIERKASKQ